MSKLKTDESVILIGAHNPLSARIGALAGFDGIWWSSFELSTSFGLPDASLVWPDEVAFMVQRASNQVLIPHVVDADAGYGGTRQLAVAVRRLKQAGASVICVEDQVHPKYNSLLPSSERQLCSIPDMVERIKTIQGVIGPQQAIFARVESFVVGEGLDAALERANAYADAGCDAIVVHSTKQDLDEIMTFSKSWRRDIPLVAIPTTYETYGTRALADTGFRIVIYANVLMRSAVKAMYEAAGSLSEAQCLEAVRGEMASIEEVVALIDHEIMNPDR